MSDIDKAITTGWHEIRIRLDKPDDLFDYIGIEKKDLLTMAEGLRLSVDLGIVEYKRSLLHSIMSRLGTLKYDSKAITDLNTQVKKGSYLTVLPILERLFVLGILRVPTPEEEEHKPEPEEKTTKPLDIKTIVAEVRNMIKEQPALQNNSDIKRIFLQLKYYNTELEKKKSLEPNIPKEKKASFEANFQERFNEIHGKIQNAYRSIISQEEKKSRPELKLPILKRYDFSTCEHIYRKQAEAAAKLYHTLSFAQKERYQMREILLQIASAEPYYKEEYKKEIECYKKIAPFSGDAERVCLALGEKLRRYCERSVEWRPR